MQVPPGQPALDEQPSPSLEPNLHVFAQYPIGPIATISARTLTGAAEGAAAGRAAAAARAEKVSPKAARMVVNCIVAVDRNPIAIKGLEENFMREAVMDVQALLEDSEVGCFGVYFAGFLIACYR